MLALAAAAALHAALALAPSRAGAEPAEFLPVRHPAYEEIEALAARGRLDSIAVYTRPLARIDVARALLRARRLDPAVETDLHFQRLERELARELTDLDAPPGQRETGPLVDLGPREQRFRLSAAGHLLGDYDERRDAAHYMFRDESAAGARMSLQLWPAIAGYEELGLTRIRSARAFVDPIVQHTDLEIAVLRAELTARAGAFTAAAGYDDFRWGPGRRGTLLLSDAAGPMGFLSESIRIGGRVTAAAMTGQISRAEQRYVSAHRIEAEIGRRLTVGLGEAVRYRSADVDLLYALGILPYAIVRRIQIRDASSDSVRVLERANVMASADVVWRPIPDLSFTSELLVDDIATKSTGVPDRFGYQLGVRSDRPFGTHAIRLLGEYTRVRNYTYSVDYDEDFVYRGRPLGFVLGPDVENIFTEAVFDVSRDWQLRWSGDFTNHGEGRIGVPWVEGSGAVSNAGLSGVVERRREVFGDARWMPRDDVDLSVGVGYRRLVNEDNVAGRDRNAWLGRMALDVRY
ncbi:MAG: hypothetical protein ACM3PF_10500 [Bacteroidota bacterium]